MYSVTIDKRGGFVHAPRNKMTAENMVNLKSVENKGNLYQNIYTNFKEKKKYGLHN